MPARFKECAIAVMRRTENVFSFRTIRDAKPYGHVVRVALVHGCRTVSELNYGGAGVGEDVVFAASVEQLLYHPTAIREPFKSQGRLRDLLGTPIFGRLNPDACQAMLRGSLAMLIECRGLFEDRRFTQGSGNGPGTFAVEKACAEA